MRPITFGYEQWAEKSWRREPVAVVAGGTGSLPGPSRGCPVTRRQVNMTFLLLPFGV
jgi:hypothetical protein